MLRFMLDKQTVAHLKTGIELATAEEADRFGLIVGALNALTNRRMGCAQAAAAEYLAVIVTAPLLGLTRWVESDAHQSHGLTTSHTNRLIRP